MILDKHTRQAGNAVPPPLGTAIGHEIRKCICDTTISSNTKFEFIKSCSNETRQKMTIVLTKITKLSLVAYLTTIVHQPLTIVQAPVLTEAKIRLVEQKDIRHI